jgi:hypothetical protein
MPQFVLMLRDNGSFPSNISPEEIQAIIEKYRVWNERVGGSGEKLRDDEGRILVRNGGSVTVTDGPYVESKEVVGGFMIIEASSYDDAVRLCQDCPHLEFGSIEIRQVEPT